MNISLGVETQPDSPATNHTLEREVGSSVHIHDIRWMCELVSARLNAGLHSLRDLDLARNLNSRRRSRAELGTSQGPERTAWI
jgi:hypothetical protein